MKKFGNRMKIAGIAIAIGPFVIALFSLPLNLLFWCTDGGGSPGTCAIGGEAMGIFVWSLAMMHWFTLITLFPGIIISIIGSVVYRRGIQKERAQKA